MIIYLYEMEAIEGEGDKLVRALEAMGDAMAAYAGLTGTQILRDTGNPTQFRFLENWTTLAAHDQSAGGVPKDVMNALRATLAAKPALTVYEQLGAA